MKNYIGVKIVKAEPMTKGEFERMRGAVSPMLEVDTTPGYMVKYPDGYLSWSPQSVFEKEYMELECQEFINSEE